MARPATNKTQSKLDTWLWHWLSPLGVMAKRGRDTSLHHSILKANCNKNKLKKICSCISTLVTKRMASATGHTSSSENDVATRCICCRNSSSFKAQRALAATCPGFGRDDSGPFRRTLRGADAPSCLSSSLTTHSLSLRVLSRPSSLEDLQVGLRIISFPSGPSSSSVMNRPSIDAKSSLSWTVCASWHLLLYNCNHKKNQDQWIVVLQL